MSASDLPKPDYVMHTHEECGDLNFWNEASLRAYGDKRAREALQTGWAIEITRPDGGKHLFTGNGSPSHKPEVWEERFWGLAREWRGHLANRGLAAELVRVLWVPPTVLAAAPVLGEQALCPACGHDVNSPRCPCDPPVPGGQP